VTPRLRFVWDPTPEKAARIDNLLSEWQKEERPLLDVEIEEEVEEDLDQDDLEFDTCDDEEDE
jgi:hypothetical protein